MSMEIINFVEVGSGGTSSISLTSIPGTYDDLMLEVSLKTDYTSTYSECNLRFNGSTSTNMHRIELYQQGNTVSWGRSSGVTEFRFVIGSTTGAGSFGCASIHIPQYTRAAYKEIGSQSSWSNSSSVINFSQDQAGLWLSTSAINSIELTPRLGTVFVQYSTATLYGITKA